MAYHKTNYLQCNSAHGLLLDLICNLSRLRTFGYGLSDDYFLSGIRSDDFRIMPLPGALGAAEGSYTLFFSNIFIGSDGTKYVGISTFIWRFLTFYLPIIAGLILSTFVGKFMNVEAPDKSTIKLTEEELKGDPID